MTAPFFHSHRETDTLVVLETSGSLDAVAMEIALDMLVREMEGMHHGALLMHARGLEFPSLGAIGVELRHWAQIMAMIEKIDRVAILTDDGWLQNLARMESVLIPNLEIRTFDPEDETAARAWLAEAQTATA